MSDPVLLSGCRVVAARGVLKRGDVLIEGKRIRRVAPRVFAPRARVMRAAGLTAIPGLIDTQINGGLGLSFSDATPEQVRDVGRRLAAHGVTGYLPTLISLPRKRTLKGVAALASAARLKGGARILGLHLEGPFLSPERRGAHRETHLRRPTLAEFRACLKASRGLLRMMTIAPELPGALKVIREGTRRGVIMSAGHSVATAAQVREAVRRGGLRHVTHVFNAMPSLHHREETLVGEALLSGDLSCGFIYDRVHLNPTVARLLVRLKPPGKLVLVSDTTFAMDARDGEVSADGERYVVRKGEVRVKSTGRLAGSAHSLLHGVRCLVADLGLGLEEAVALASAAPARLLGLGDRKGALRPGADADVVLLDDRLRVKATFVEGEQVHGNHH